VVEEEKRKEGIFCFSSVIRKSDEETALKFKTMQHKKVAN